jgi:hypothetical protein
MRGGLQDKAEQSWRAEDSCKQERGGEEKRGEERRGEERRGEERARALYTHLSFEQRLAGEERDAGSAVRSSNERGQQRDKPESTQSTAKLNASTRLPADVC